LIVVLLLALFAVPLVSAQENSDLTEEELALLERILAARAQLDIFTSFVEEANQTQSQALNINMEEVSQAFNQSVITERLQTVIQDEDVRNIAGTVTATVSEEEPLPSGQPATSSYTLVAEFRLVDETMYVNAVYESPDPTLPEIPEGWAIFTIGENETLDFLGLDDVLEEQDPLEREERLKNTAKDITVESATLDDGTPVDLITVVFNQDAFAAQLDAGDAANPFVDALLAGISENSTMTMVVTLDMDGNPLRVESQLLMESLGLIGSEIDPATFPEGMTLDMVIEFSEVQAYSQFDEEFEPASVPEEVGE
jgi:hypothetical protein